MRDCDHRHLDATDDYNFTYLNRSDRPADHPYGSFDTHVADIADSDAIRPAFTGQDAVIHLAAYPYTDGNWDDVFEPNILGMYNALTAARDAGVETFIYGSTNHVVGQYELEHAPDIYRPDHDITVRPTDPIRPDSYYGTTKAFGELLGRQYIEADHVEFPTQFYALRICTVNSEQYDHPYGDAEFGVDAGDWDRSSEAYDRAVNRMKAMCTRAVILHTSSSVVCRTSPSSSISSTASAITTAGGFRFGTLVTDSATTQSMTQPSGQPRHRMTHRDLSWGTPEQSISRSLTTRV